MRIQSAIRHYAYLRLASSLIFLLLLTAPAAAGPVIFLDRDAYNAAAQPNRSLVFDADVTDCEFIPMLFACTHTFDGLLKVTYDVAGIGLVGNSLGLGFFSGQGSSHSFLTPVSAIAFDLVAISFSGPGATFTPSLFSFAGTTFSLPPLTPLDSPLFFGAIFDTPQTQIPASVTQVGTGMPGGYQIQNLAVTTVPEPGTLLLFGSAVAAAMCSRRFRFASSSGTPRTRPASRRGSRDAGRRGNAGGCRSR
jgi:PEP-CTERM motif